MKPKDSLKVLIVGTGYVGLTTGLSLAYLGHQVYCIDNNKTVVDKLNAGIPTIYESGIKELMQESKKNIIFSDEIVKYLPNSDVIVIAVGTPSKNNGDCDLSYVEAVAEEIGNNLNGEKTPVIVNKSTVPVGSSRRVEAVVRSRLEQRGIDMDVLVASNPEFLREGVALNDTLYPDRIVVGADDVRAINLLRQMYAPILEQTFTPPKVIPRPDGFELPAFVTTSATSAELIKYSANAFLAMKISFINEIAGLAERVGADIQEVSRGIGLDKRIGQRFLGAGAGWGGSCFPKDTQAILHTGFQYGYEMPLIKSTIEVNQRQRLCMVEKLQSLLKVIRGSTIGVLGLSFKPDTDDLRDSPSIDIIHRLLDMGARVKAYDPVAMENCRKEYPNLEVEYVDSVSALVNGCDAIALITDWKEFSYINWDEAANQMRQKIVIDGRNMLQREELENLGFNYRGVGR